MKEKIKNILLNIISFFAWIRLRFKIANQKIEDYIELRAKAEVVDNFSYVIEDVLRKSWDLAERNEQVTMLHKRIKANMMNNIQEILKKYK
jgi:hypothetical protein